VRTGTLLLAVLLLCPVVAQRADWDRDRLASTFCGRRTATESVRQCAPERPQTDDGQLHLYLRKATGSLTVQGYASCDTYQVYFHVPISFHEQAPVLLQVTCPRMIDYRFVREDPPNLLVAARLLSADSAVLDWTAWVLVKENSYANFPMYVPIPTPDELPDSVKPWLEETDCCQLSAPIVQHTADSLRDTTTNLIKLAQDVCDFCRSIPAELPHSPWAFDAEYALKWGNSCTGHAHAAAALLRASGVPARTLLSMPDWASNYMMHWIIEYYVPEYGWVRMETSGGVNREPPQDELVVRACNPGDEFPVWFPCAIDDEWHTSDTAYGMWTPRKRHNAFAVLTLSDSIVRAEYAIALTDWVFGQHSAYSGIRLTPAEYAAFTSGLSHQTDALAHIQAGDLPGYIIEMEEALIDYQNVNPAPVQTFFSEDFENGPVGWTHGGSQDEWELGVPTYGPTSAHSGSNCWGTNLDGPYANNDDCWLQSPRIDLSNLASANLSFWIWNRVQGHYGQVFDPVWVEVSRDGSTFLPLTSWMGGVNDDPEITGIGGWSHVFLDLAQYLGDTVRLRFRFRSDSSAVFAGSYIDDVLVSGRRTNAGVEEAAYAEVRADNPMPTVVRGVLYLPAASSHKPRDSRLLDISGRKVLDLKPGVNVVRALAPGVYFVRKQDSMGRGFDDSRVTKIVVTR